MPVGLVEEVVRWLRPAFDVAGYPLVIVAVLLERSILLGLVVPGEVILALGGLYAARGEMNVALLIVGASLAAITGESVGFLLGRRYGQQLLDRLPLPKRARRKVPELHEHFERRGGPTVVLGRMAAGIGAGVPFVAGMAGMRYRTFIAWDGPAIAVWATAVTLFGFLLGSNLSQIDRLLGNYGLIVTGIFVAFIAWSVWRRKRTANPG